MAAQSDNRLKDRDLTFKLGMQSAGDPEMLPEGAYARGFNVIRRGGVVQARPGYTQRLHLPAGRLQGATFFRPSGSDLQIIIAIDGRIYRSLPPFDEYEQISGLQFSNQVERVFFCRTEQSVTQNPDGSLKLIPTKAVLMIQDGDTAPASWDGAVGTHLTGSDTTPTGTVMVWSGGRLWVARESKVFASDIYDPIHFTEGQYIGPTGIGAFIMPSNVTAMSEVPGPTPFLLVFTDSKGIAIQSNIRQRVLWDTTPGFIYEVLPDVGCVAPFSVVTHLGFLWWFSAQGLTNYNLAAQAFVSSERRVADDNMAYSKGRLSKDLSGVAIGSFEGYLLCSVPYAGRYNAHTWCADLQGLDTSLEQEGPSWDSYWTGTRPVQWLTMDVNRQSRVFFVSVDHDGENRLWEAFQDFGRDNGCDVVWGFETRAYIFQNKGLKTWKFAKVYPSEIWGDVDFKISWAGSFRGLYKTSCVKRVSAARGCIDAQQEISAEETILFAFKKQSRTLTTEDERNSADGPFSSCGVESDRTDEVDVGFQLCIMGSGPGGIRSTRVFAVPENDDSLKGVCEADEDPFLAVRFDGAASGGDTLAEVVEDLKAAPTIYAASSTVLLSYGGVTVTGVGHASSSFSQQAADKLARQTAQMRAAHDLKVQAPPFFGGF